MAFIGFVLVLASFYSIQDITKLSMSPLPDPHYWLFGMGVFLILVSIILYFLEQGSSRINLPKAFGKEQKLIKNSLFFSAPINLAKYFLGRVQNRQMDPAHFFYY